MLQTELSWAERGHLWLRLGVRLILAILLIWGSVRLGPPLFSLFAPFLLALVMAWLLSPLVKVLRKYLKLPQRIMSFALLLLIFAALVALIWGLLTGVIREILSLTENWEELVSSFEGAVDAIGESFFKIMSLLPDSVHKAADNLLNQFFQWLDDAIPMLLSVAAGGISSVAKGLPSFIVAAVAFVMASYFITSDYPRIRTSFTQRLPRGPRIFLIQVKRAVSAGFGGYIKAQLILSVGVFFILLVGFFLIRQPYALLLALILAVIDFIPILGAGTVLIPWALLEVFSGAWKHAIGLLVVWGLVSLFRRGAEPRVLGNQTGLSPLISLISVYVGMKLAGVLGMILGPVICLVVLNIGNSGVMDRTIRDVKLAFADLAAILRGGDPPDEVEEDEEIWPD